MTSDYQHDGNVVSKQELLDTARRHLAELSSLIDALGQYGLSDDEIAVELGMSIAEASAVASHSNCAWFIRLEGQCPETTAEQHRLVGLQQLKEVVASLAGDKETGEAFSSDLAALIERHVHDTSLATAIKQSLEC